MNRRLALATVVTLAAPLAFALAPASCVSDDSNGPVECTTVNGALCFDAAFSEDSALPGFDGNASTVDTGVGDSSRAADVTTDAPQQAVDASDANMTTDASDSGSLADSTVSPVPDSGSDSGTVEPADGATPVDASDGGAAMDANDAAAIVDSGPLVPEILVSGQNQPEQLAVAAGLIYWSNTGDSTLWREPTNSTPGDGGAATSITFAPASPIVAMMADTNNTYFATKAGDVFQVGHTQTTALKLTSGQGTVGQLATDGTYLYWTVYTATGYIGRTMIGAAVGPDASAVSPVLNMPRSIMTMAGQVYFTMSNGASTDGIQELNPDGGTPIELINGHYYSTQLVSDGSYFFWADDDPTQSPASLFRRPLDGGAEQIFSNSSIHPLLVLGGPALYEVSSTEGYIYAFNTQTLVDSIPYRFAYGAGAFASDTTSLYWTDFADGNVWTGLK